MSLQGTQPTKIFIIVMVTIIILGLGSLVTYERINEVYFKYNYLPAELVFEFVFLFVCLSSVSNKFDVFSMLIPWLLVGYMIITWVIFSINNVWGYSTTDYILIYKSCFYMTLISLPLNKKDKKEEFYIIFNTLVVLFFTKYIISIFIFKIPRPGVYTENNFELLMLIILYLAIVFHHDNINKYIKCMFFGVILVSGSRSAIACLVFSMLLMRKKRGPLHFIVYISSFAVLSVISLYVIYLRMDGGGIDSVDRIKFLYVFLNEWSHFNASDILFGRNIITPMAHNSCSELSFYSNLFSPSGGFVCFSVILHSFILRELYDHGVFGLVFICALFYFLLKRNDFSNKFSLIILSIVLINGLSVSAFNSVFFSFPVALILIYSKPLLHKDE